MASGTGWLTEVCLGRIYPLVRLSVHKGLAMSTSDLTRLTITWTKETDLALRSYLGSQGLKKGALSEFIEDAVRWRLFDTTVREVRSEMAKAGRSRPLSHRGATGAKR